jgi:crotonobetainyl-CoA:carnitine CoA-transferase CaiB-like acyl-CoA transferase
VYLNGLKVLEVGDSVAGAAAADTLRQFGATVEKLRPRTAPTTSHSGEVLRELLDAEKTMEVADLRREYVAERAGTADVVLVDRVAGWDIEAMTLADYAGWVGASNRRAWVTVSAFGLTGPRAAWIASELVVSAGSGFLDCSRDEATDDWLPTAGAQSLLAAGTAAALAACHAVDQFRATGNPVHADVSAQEAALCVGPAIQCSSLLLGGVGEVGKSRMGAPNRSYPCTDGYVHISAMEERHWQGVVHVLGLQEWAASLTGNAVRLSEAARIDAAVAAWTVRHGKLECESLLQAAGVPATAVLAPSEIPVGRHFAARGTITPVELPTVGSTKVVGRSYTTTQPTFESLRAAPRTGRADLGVRGLRVLEASHVLSVPLTGALLGAMGADVIKLEDPVRPEFYRRSGPFIDGETGPDRGVLFAMSNHSKRSGAATIGFADTTVRGLFDQCDVWVENLGAKRSGDAGLDAESLAAGRPGILAVSSSGYGHDGPNADYRVYAYNVQAACGMSALTTGTDGMPGEFRGAWADFITGYYLATLVAAWAISEHDAGSSTSVDFSMVELAAARHNEFIAAGIDTRAEAIVESDARDWVLRLDEGAGVAISATATELVKALQVTQDWGAEPDTETLKAFLVRECAARGAEEFCEWLQDTGIACTPVVGAQELVNTPHLQARGLFAEVTHPVWGSRRMLGLPWALDGHRPAIQPPPLLGDTDGWRER